MELRAIISLTLQLITWLRKYLSSHITVASVISSSAPSCFPVSYPPVPSSQHQQREEDIAFLREEGMAFLHKGHVYGHGTLFAGLQPAKQGQFVPRSQNSA